MVSSVIFNRRENNFWIRKISGKRLADSILVWNLLSGLFVQLVEITCIHSDISVRTTCSRDLMQKILMGSQFKINPPTRF